MQQFDGQGQDALTMRSSDQPYTRGSSVEGKHWGGEFACERIRSRKDYRKEVACERVRGGQGELMKRVA